MSFYLRRVYLQILTIQIFIMYVVRYWILKKDPSVYTFIKWDFVIEKKFLIEKLPIKYLILFFLWAYVLSLFIPKKIDFLQLKNKKIFIYLYYIQNFFLIFEILISGKRMNSFINKNILIKILEFLFTGILNKEILLFVVLYITIRERKGIYKILIAYFIPSVLVGSKAGLIIPITIIFFFKLGLKEKILNIKNIVLTVIMFFLYPIFITVSWMMRSQDYNLVNYNFNFKIYDIFLSLSRRITGLDILNQKAYLTKYDLLELNCGNLLIYYLKGIIPATIVDTVLGKKESQIYGTLLSKVIFDQPYWVINACEATLFGTFYYNYNPMLAFMSFNIILLGMVFFIKILKSKEEKNFLMMIFVFSFLGVFFKGNPEEFLFFIRFWFVYTILKRL